MPTNTVYRHTLVALTAVLLLASCADTPAPPPPTGVIESAITHDGMQRDYILYVPADYADHAPMPLVLNFHGYTSSAANLMDYSDFNAIADTAHFIVAYPQGTLLEGKTHWNVGGWTLDSTVDDVAFVDALLDSLSATYAIDPARIYSTGMSNGGYMSFLLACQRSERIAAVASVTGAMTPQTMEACAPTRPVPVMQIHGDEDRTVPYDGDPRWTIGIDAILAYWSEINRTEGPPQRVALPDADPADSSTVEHYSYSSDGAVEHSAVEHYKVLGGDHDWPGAWGNMDFHASSAVWGFFAQHALDGPAD